MIRKLISQITHYRVMNSIFSGSKLKISQLLQELFVSEHPSKYFLSSSILNFEVLIKKIPAALSLP